MEAVEAGWLKIEAERLAGKDVPSCLKAAYDHHAGLIVKGRRPMTEAVLVQQIPGLVFEGAPYLAWIAYPLTRRANGKGKAEFPPVPVDPPSSGYEMVPESELTETYCGRKVAKGFEQKWKLIFLSRIEHWRTTTGITAASGSIDPAEVDDGLPELSDTTKRILHLRKEALMETYRLTGDSITRYVSADDRSRRNALNKLPELSGRNLQQWLALYTRARRDCGVTSSVDFSSARFVDLATEYFKLWSPRVGCEIFASQLAVLKSQVLRDMIRIWAMSEATREWYKAVCEPSVNAALSGKVSDFTSRARNSELVFLASNVQKIAPGSGSPEDGSGPVYCGQSEPEEETQEVRSARRKAVVDPLMKKAGVISDEDWANRAGENMDRNTPRDYRNGLTKRLRSGSREALAKALNIASAELPD